MAHDVMVFAPAPQLTVTVERPVQDTEIHIHPGGQGIWQARMITSLGVPVVLCAALGGETGQVLRTLILHEGFDLRAVDRRSTSGAYLHDRRDGQRVVVAEVAGAPLSRHELDELYGLALAEGLKAGVAVLSGPPDRAVVPPDLYRRLATDLAGNGARVIADLSGEYLTAVLPGRPVFVKASHEELIRDGRAADDSRDALVRALRELRAQGAGAAIVSRADLPALALVEDEVIEVTAPRLEAADHRGAGDSMTAGVAATLALGGDLHSAIRTGAAAGALNVTRHGLGTGRQEAIATLAERVQLIPLTAGVAP